MTPWHIIRCDWRKERFVADAIKRMKFEVWVPEYLILTRHPASRRHSTHQNIFLERYAMATPKIIFAAIPEAVHAEVGAIRYCRGLKRDSQSVAYSMPYEDLLPFIEALSVLNREIRNRMIPPARVEKRIMKLKDGLAEYKRRRWGEAVVKLEEAA